MKLPRALTHEGELTARSDVLDCFVEEVRGLGDKLAVLLVQLPPKLEFNRRVATLSRASRRILRCGLVRWENALKVSDAIAR